MLYGLYQSAAGMLSNQYRQDVVANNLANATTPAFKRDLALLMQRPLESEVRPLPGGPSPVWEQMSGGLFTAPTATDFTDGPLEITDNDLDVALRGEGFFVVQSGSEVRYSRDGRLTLGTDGRLVQQSSGAAVLDPEGRPIVLAADQPIVIENDGRILQAGTERARLAIVSFADPQRLMKTGRNQYAAAKQDPPQPSQARVVRRAVEGSNVATARSLVDLLEISRAYELNAGLLTIQNETLGRAINDVARIT